MLLLTLPPLLPLGTLRPLGALARRWNACTLSPLKKNRGGVIFGVLFYLLYICAVNYIYGP